MEGGHNVIWNGKGRGGLRKRHTGAHRIIWVCAAAAAAGARLRQQHAEEHLRVHGQGSRVSRRVGGI